MTNRRCENRASRLRVCDPNHLPTVTPFRKFEGVRTLSVALAHEATWGRRALAYECSTRSHL